MAEISQPPDACHDAGHLQFGVDARAIEAVEDPAAAERLRRLEGDAELRDRLMWRGYSGPEYDRFQNILIEYAYPIIRAWLISGAIVEQIRRKRLAGVPTLHEKASEPEHAHDLAVATTMHAVKNFRDKVLVPGIWNPAKGASLRTFFVGRCLIDFPNQYKVWRTRVFRPRPQGTPPPEPIEIEYHPERRLIHDEGTAALLDADDTARKIFTLIAQGWTHPEIAEVLGTTAKAIERRVARFKEKKRRG